MTSPDSAWLAALVDELASGQVVVRDDFLPTATIAALREEALTAHARGEFTRAGIGAGRDPHHIDAIRSDSTRWLEFASNAQRTYHDRIETLRLALNRELFLGLRSHEAHFAVYEPGAFYARHLDSFRDSNKRAVSTVLYLNDRPADAAGGEFAWWDAVDAADAPPRGLFTPASGRFVCFSSETLPHAVLPTSVRRVSLTGWYRRDDAP